MRHKMETYIMNHIIPAILGSLLLRWSVGLFDYSGKGKGPMYGDYEAQRHWMEITYNLPMDEWYFETENNQLEYWGLDYPPLTAYHSLLMGYIAHYYNPEYVALNSSRGYESPQHKLFMRYTVFFSDLATYIAGVMLYSVFNSRPSSRGPLSIYAEVYALLMYPGLILIDYGHFQYNCVSLGLALMSYTTLNLGYGLVSAVLFSLALSYKQMLLYLALPFFFFHLGMCRKDGKIKGLLRFLKLSAVVILTFAISWYPVSRNTTQLSQVLHRIFPIARGVFEDKVSNLWCLINVFFKFRLYFTNETIAAFCAILTFIACLPSCINLFFKPTRHKLNLCLIISSLAFFLCSYQVHEKSILIVALPVMLYFRIDTFHCFWFLIVSSCSMFPLLVKDNLQFAFVGLNLIFIISADVFYNITVYEVAIKNRRYMHYIYHIFHITLYIWAIILISACFIKPPERYPDLYPLLISCYAALHFIYFFVYFNYLQLFRKHKKQS